MPVKAIFHKRAQKPPSKMEFGAKSTFETAQPFTATATLKKSDLDLQTTYPPPCTWRVQDFYTH
jgi:hypothetical protein